MAEPLLPVGTAYKNVVGQRIDPNLYQRWIRDGVSNVKLKTVKVGGRRMCSESDIQRFIEECTAASDRQEIAVRTNRQRQANVSRADRDLKRFGI